MIKREISLYNKDGSLNVKKVGLSSHFFSDYYYHLLRVKWPKFLCLVMAAYLILNTIFACFYYITPSTIANTQNTFWDAWIFSFQTSSTLGYGYFHPTNTFSHTIAVVDVVFGMLFVAIVTGITFTKLSRPNSKILFSHKILISPFNGRQTLMIRLGNRRANEIIDAEVCLVCVMTQYSEEGIKMRRLIDLKLDRNRTPLFSLSWTLFHPLDQDSPLHNMQKEYLENSEVSFILSFTGIDDVYSATIHDRKVWDHHQIEFDRYFEDIIGNNDQGERIIDYNKFQALKTEITS